MRYLIMTWLTSAYLVESSVAEEGELLVLESGVVAGFDVHLVRMLWHTIHLLNLNRFPFHIAYVIHLFLCHLIQISVFVEKVDLRIRLKLIWIIFQKSSFLCFTMVSFNLLVQDAKVYLVFDKSVYFCGNQFMIILKTKSKLSLMHFFFPIWPLIQVI